MKRYAAFFVLSLFVLFPLSLKADIIFQPVISLPHPNQESALKNSWAESIENFFFHKAARAEKEMALNMLEMKLKALRVMMQAA